MSKKSQGHNCPNFWRNFPTYILKPSLELQNYEKNNYKAETEQKNIQQLIRYAIKNIGKKNKSKGNLQIILLNSNVKHFLQFLKKIKVYKTVEIKQHEFSIAQQVVRQQICLNYLKNVDDILKGYDKSDKEKFKQVVNQIIQNGLSWPIQDNNQKKISKKMSKKEEKYKQEQFGENKKQNNQKKKRLNYNKILNANSQRQSQIQNQQSMLQGGSQSSSQKHTQLTQMQNELKYHDSMVMEEEQVYESKNNQSYNQFNFSIAEREDLVNQADENIFQDESNGLFLDDSLFSLINLDFLPPSTEESSDIEKLF